MTSGLILFVLQQEQCHSGGRLRQQQQSDIKPGVCIELLAGCRVGWLLDGQSATDMTRSTEQT